MGADLEASKAGRRAKKAKAPEKVTGMFTALPWQVLDSEAYLSVSPPARALLVDLARQSNGRNNGHIQATRAWLSQRGWNRPATTKKLLGELLAAHLIVMTKRGGLNAGAHQFAVTWLRISDWKGLCVTEQDYHPGLYLLPLPQKPAKPKKSQWTPHVLEKDAARTAHVLEADSPRTPHVPEKRVLGRRARTPHVHNVEKPLHRGAARGGGLECLDDGNLESTTGGQP